jgi:hypothetical protein
MRTKLVPRLNGDFVPPAERTLFVADRQTGTVTSLRDAGAGPVFASDSLLTFGVRPRRGSDPSFAFATRAADFRDGESHSSSIADQSTPPADGLVETVHADYGHIREAVGATQPQTVESRYMSFAVLNGDTGALESQTVQFTTRRGNLAGQTVDHGSASRPAGHPVVRSDAYVAFHMGGDIQTVSFPTNDLAVAPAPITSAAAERDPAWAPDDVNLGFIRTSGGQRRLGVFNATPGIQTILNPLASLGPEAPSPQTRAYQEVWGGLSIANAPASTAPAITCDAACRAQIAGASGPQTIPLTPKVTTTTKIGIFVVRVTGKRKLLGRSAPRLRVVGKVPLGTARKGRRNRFRWNGKVNGKRLKRGTYLLTYRSLKGTRITNTSGSIRFKIAKGGKVRQVRSEPLRTPKR